MDSLHSILSNRNFDEPPEVTSLKKYVDDTFQVKASVQVTGQSLIVTVASASLANTLRLRTPEIRRRCQISEKRLVIRIGQVQ
jgi:hypothetical protein